MPPRLRTVLVRLQLDEPLRVVKTVCEPAAVSKPARRASCPPPLRARACVGPLGEGTLDQVRQHVAALSTMATLALQLDAVSVLFARPSEARSFCAAVNRDFALGGWLQAELPEEACL